MARLYANIFCAIWDDDDFCALSSDAQRTYFMLVTQTEITACGTLALTLRRWGRTMREKDRPSLEPALEELAEARFILIDWDNEELFVRTFPKHDGGYKHAQRVKAVIAYAEAVRSPSLRTAVALELRKLGIETGIELPPDDDPRGTGPPLDSHSSATQVPTESGRSVVTEVSTDHTPHSTNREPHSANLGGGQPPRTATPEPLDASAEPPAMFCTDHPNGTTDACGPCGTAKMRYKAWTETKLAGEVAARSARAAAIRECLWCDESGIRLDVDTGRPLGRCDHTEPPPGSRPANESEAS